MNNLRFIITVAYILTRLNYSRAEPQMIFGDPFEKHNAIKSDLSSNENLISSKVISTLSASNIVPNSEADGTTNISLLSADVEKTEQGDMSGQLINEPDKINLSSDKLKQLSEKKPNDKETSFWTEIMLNNKKQNVLVKVKQVTIIEEISSKQPSTLGNNSKTSESKSINSVSASNTESASKSVDNNKDKTTGTNSNKPGTESTKSIDAAAKIDNVDTNKSIAEKKNSEVKSTTDSNKSEKTEAKKEKNDAKKEKENAKAEAKKEKAIAKSEAKKEKADAKAEAKTEKAEVKKEKAEAKKEKEEAKKEKKNEAKLDKKDEKTKTEKKDEKTKTGDSKSSKFESASKPEITVNNKTEKQSIDSMSSSEKKSSKSFSSSTASSTTEANKFPYIKIKLPGSYSSASASASSIEASNSKSVNSSTSKSVNSSIAINNTTTNKSKNNKTVVLSPSVGQVTKLPIESADVELKNKNADDKKTTSDESKIKQVSVNNKDDASFTDVLDILKSIPGSEKNLNENTFIQGSFSFPKNPELDKKVFKLSGYISPDKSALKDKSQLKSR